MRISHSIRFAATAALTAAACALPSAASAQFHVDRTQVRLSGRANSAMVRLTNDSGETMRFDVRIFNWTHPEDGTEILKETTEAVAVPGSVTLPPQGSQTVRVGTTATTGGATERAYRLIIEELPKPPSKAAGAIVAMRTRMSIPVFLEPVKGTATLELGVPSIAKGMPTVGGKNTGTVHLMVESIRFRGADAKGGETFNVLTGGGYILPSLSRVFTLPAAVPAAQCKASTKIVVDAVVNGTPVTHEAPMAPAACAG